MNRIQTDKIQPLSEGVERALLGACLRLEENVPVIIGGLEINDFSSPINRDIFSAVESLHQKNAAIDLLSVSNELKIQGKEIPASKVVELLDESMDGLDLSYHINQLKTYSKRRKLQFTLENALRKL